MSVLRLSILKQGVVPTTFWNPSNFGGTRLALLGDPQMPVYYLSTVMILLAPNVHVAIRYAILTHVVISGLAMYTLMVVWKQKPEASLIAAVGYMLSGFFYARLWAGHMSIIFGYAWMPLTIALFEVATRKGKLRYSALAGLPLAMQIMSGGTVIFFYTLHLLGLYVCYKLVSALLTSGGGKTLGRNSLKSAWLPAKMTMGTLFFAFSLSAVKVLAIREPLKLTVFTARFSPAQADLVIKGGFPSVLAALQALVSRVQTGTQAGFHEYVFYLGLLLFLALPSVVAARKNHLTFFLMGATLLSMILATGNKPIFAYFELSLFRFFGHGFRLPCRFLVMTQLTIPALAGITITKMCDRIDECKISESGRLRLKRALVTTILVLVLLDLCTFGLAYVATTEMPAGYEAIVDATIIEWNKPQIYELGMAITIVSYAVLLMLFLPYSLVRARISPLGAAPDVAEQCRIRSEKDEFPRQREGEKNRCRQGTRLGAEVCGRDSTRTRITKAPLAM